MHFPVGGGPPPAGSAGQGGLSLEQGSTVDGRVIYCGDNGLNNFIWAGFWFGMCVGYLG